MEINIDCLNKAWKEVSVHYELPLDVRTTLIALCRDKINQEQVINTSIDWKISGLRNLEIQVFEYYENGKPITEELLSDISVAISLAWRGIGNGGK